VNDEPLDMTRLSAMEPHHASHLLSGVHAAALSGESPPYRPRKVIRESWRRVRRHGLDPDQGAHSGLLALDEVEHRRQSSPLGAVLPTLRDGLKAAAQDSG
jgi:hypothetical protein